MQLPSKQLVVGSIPARATIFLPLKYFVCIPAKSKSWLWQINLSVRIFSFCSSFFPFGQKTGCSLSCGLPILQKISLRRRESRLAARALPSAVKSIFRRPRSAAFRRLRLTHALSMVVLIILFFLRLIVGRCPPCRSPPGLPFFWLFSPETSNLRYLRCKWRLLNIPADCLKNVGKFSDWIPIEFCVASTSAKFFQKNFSSLFAG